jgi:glycosyltransferase involved in cell wall biosynthesis
VTKLLLVSYFFPPAATVQRPLRFAAHLSAGGVETHVLAPDDPKWLYADDAVTAPASVAVHRARYLGPRARRIGDEVDGRRGPALALAQLRHLPPRLLVPDPTAPWVLTATPAAIRLVKRRGIDVVMTSSSPSSVHLVGAAVKRATGVAWVADVRDSLQANPHRRTERPLVRAKQTGERGIAALVARYADAIVAATEGIAGELASIRPSSRVAVIRNGCDFEDFAGLEYSGGKRFRLTHTGSFYGERDPRPVLAALARSDAEVIARFAGDFRPRDRACAAQLGLGERVELHGRVPRRRALELQRDSEALLLLIPEAGGRGRGVITAKLFEYLAAGRPIVAAVPPDGEAAAIVREANAGVVVEPDDVGAIAQALSGLVKRFERGRLEPVRLSPELRSQLSREARAAELAALLQCVT